MPSRLDWLCVSLILNLFPFTFTELALVSRLGALSYFTTLPWTRPSRTTFLDPDIRRTIEGVHPKDRVTTKNPTIEDHQSKFLRASKQTFSPIAWWWLAYEYDVICHCLNSSLEIPMFCVGGLVWMLWCNVKITMWCDKLDDLCLLPFMILEFPIAYVPWPNYSMCHF